MVATIKHKAGYKDFAIQWGLKYVHRHRVDFQLCLQKKSKKRSSNLFYALYIDSKSILSLLTHLPFLFVLKIHLAAHCKKPLAHKMHKGERKIPK